MALEIERKFLIDPTVIDPPWKQSAFCAFRQGYLNTDKNRTVRCRIAGDKGFLTIKGLNRGATRDEFEYEIPIEDAQQILELCQLPLIEKRRYEFEVDQHVWEIDEFIGANEGLVVAEIELESESESFVKPNWVGEEVTEDPRYCNSNLVSQPFSNWND